VYYFFDLICNKYLGLFNIMQKSSFFMRFGRDDKWARRRVDDYVPADERGGDFEVEVIESKKSKAENRLRDTMRRLKNESS
jgi:hypothetical protein